MEMMAAIQYILTLAQPLGSEDYYKKSQMTILGLASVLVLRKPAGMDKMDYRMLRRKYLLGWLGNLEKVSKQQ